MARTRDEDRTERIWKLSSSPRGETMRQHLRERIVPERRVSDSASQKAMTLLQRLYSKDGSSGIGARFKVTGTIGVGGMGVVRQAVQSALGRTVAIKTLKPDRRTASATLDLLREAWIAGSLDHPNVVPVHDISVDENGSPLIVLKRIEGVVWSKLVHDTAEVRERFGADDLLEWNLGILLQVLNAVRFAHSRGIVHRDLKPDNVMIGEFGEVYVVDWGLAVSLQDDGTGRLPLASDAREMAGTPCYMAPEMLGESDIPISELTDIYLVGAILYEILTGRPPHLGEDVVTLATSVVESSPVFPDSVPAGLVRICRRAMDPDPRGRFENAEQVRLAIQGFLKHRGSARLADKATAALDELEGELARPAPADAEHRQKLYRLFGACRFGFHEALATWPRNEAARAGMEQATLAMIEYELAQGDARAAAALCADLENPSPAMRRRMDEALVLAAEERRRMARLEDLSRQFDISTGRRGRIFAVLSLGLTFTIVPLILVWHYGTASFGTHAKLMIWNGTYFAVAAAVGFLARESLRESAINRRLYTILMVLFVAFAPMELGLWRAGLTASQSLLVHVFTWFLVATIVAATVERRLLPTALGYLAAAWTFILAPELVLYVVTVPHGVLTLNAVLIWKPRVRR